MPKFSKILYTLLLAIIILPLGGNCGIEAIGDRREGGHRGGLFFSCSDDISSIYSHKYRVMCGFQVVSYAELQHVVGNNGQYASVRLVGDKIEMKSQISTPKYNLDALSKDFQFGCAGLIIGTTQMGDLRAYDLACPNCDRSDRRLTLRDDGTAICPKCEIEYDLNYDGVITNRGNGTYSHPRGLYRYPITYDGLRINIIN